MRESTLAYYNTKGITAVKNYDRRLDSYAAMKTDFFVDRYRRKAKPTFPSK
jgi:hypothetical protein